MGGRNGLMMVGKNLVTYTRVVISLSWVMKYIHTYIHVSPYVTDHEFEVTTQPNRQAGRQTVRQIPSVCPNLRSERCVVSSQVTV